MRKSIAQYLRTRSSASELDCVWSEEKVEGLLTSVAAASSSCNLCSFSSSCWRRTDPSARTVPPPRGVCTLGSPTHQSRSSPEPQTPSARTHTAEQQTVTPVKCDTILTLFHFVSLVTVHHVSLSDMCLYLMVSNDDVQCVCVMELRRPLYFNIIIIPFLNCGLFYPMCCHLLVYVTCYIWLKQQHLNAGTKVNIIKTIT